MLEAKVGRTKNERMSLETEKELETEECKLQIGRVLEEVELHEE